MEIVRRKIKRVRMEDDRADRAFDYIEDAVDKFQSDVVNFWPRYENHKLSGDKTIRLPKNVVEGGQVTIRCTGNGTDTLYIESSNGDSVDILRQGMAVLVAVQGAPTKSAHWDVVSIRDYGYWSGPIKATTGGTIETNTGTYTRSDEMVTLQYVAANLDNTLGYSGAIYVDGIPFNVDPPSSGTWYGTCIAAHIWNGANDKYYITSNTSNTNPDRIYFAWSPGHSATQVTYAEIENTGSDIGFSITYRKA